MDPKAIFNGVELHEMYQKIISKTITIDEQIEASRIRKIAYDSVIRRADDSENLTTSELNRLARDVQTLVETSISIIGREHLVELRKSIVRKYLSVLRNDVRSKMAFSLEGQDIQSSLIEIRDTKLNGKGLFSRETIQPGFKLTAFPADAICVRTPAGLGYSLKQNTIAVFGYDVDMLNDEERFAMISDYGIDTGDDTTSLIAGNPLNTGDINRIGHIVNDGAFNDDIIDYPGLNQGKTPTKTDIKNMVYKYYKSAVNNKVNARFDMTFAHAPVLTCIKTIEPDEEITVCYGLMYWLKKKISFLTHDEVVTIMNETLDVDTISRICVILNYNFTVYSNRTYGEGL